MKRHFRIHLHSTGFFITGAAVEVTGATGAADGATSTFGGVVAAGGVDLALGSSQATRLAKNVVAASSDLRRGLLRSELAHGASVPRLGTLRLNLPVGRLNAPSTDIGRDRHLNMRWRRQLEPVHESDERLS